MDVVARDEIEKLAKSLIVLNKVLQNLSLFNFLKVGATGFQIREVGRVLDRHIELVLPFSEHLVNAVPEAGHEIFRQLSLLGL